MPIHWLMIFFLLAIFILIDSDGLPASYTKNEHEMKNDNVNHSNEGSNLLSETNDSKVSIETRKIPIYLNHQETMDHRHNENKKMFAEKSYQYLITALSKIAKVRSSEENSSVIEQCLMANGMQNKSTYLQNKISAKYAERPIISFNTKSSLRLVSEGTFNNSSNDKIQQGNFLCHAIQDVYISEIKEKIPSYVCTFRNNMFIVSSKRFFQDRRNSLYINIDNDILRKLHSFSVAPTNNQFNIIPAVLVLKSLHGNYNIRNPQNFQIQV